METQDIEKLQEQIKSISDKYEKLSEYVKTIVHKHENVMSSVLEHLVHQANVLKTYTNVVPATPSSETESIKPSNTHLCSAEYAEILSIEHNTPGKWGVSAKNKYNKILDFLNEYDHTDILDYGAGSANRLSNMLRSDFPDKYCITDYDPGIPEICTIPYPHSLVVCIDVLEHVEPDLIYNVLDDLERVTHKAGYFVISTQPASRVLCNGKNAHLIVQPSTWWEQELEKRFKLVSVFKTSAEMHVVVTPL